MNSILNSIKKVLNISPEHTSFDEDIIMHINSVFMILTQLGVGPSEGFSISNDEATWEQFISDVHKIQAVKSYMYLKVRMLFDPPSSSAAMAATERQINEFEWRLTNNYSNSESVREEEIQNGV